MAENLTTKYEQVTETIHEINNVVTRIDERLDIFIEKLGTLEHKIDHHIESCPIKCQFPEILGRIKVLELNNATMNELEKEMGEMKLTAKETNFISSSSSQKWKVAGQFALQVLAPLVYIIIGALIFHYFHLTAPSVNP